ncbi:flagellar hook-basal body complex protein [bacterium]|nr:flagellar hook-basal body complex protein [bacterium]
MIHGVYLSAQGAGIQSFRQDILANNLANASTTAFKRDVPVFRVFEPGEVNDDLPVNLTGERENAVGGVAVDGVVTVHESGALQKTDRPYDLGLTGEGFFHVTDGDQKYLTRNGRFIRDVTGRLVMEDSGLRVLNSAGTPVQIPEGIVDVHVASNGNISGITAAGTQALLGQLDLVTAPYESLTKVGNSLYAFPDPDELRPAQDRVQVRQGFVEASGVNPVLEMTSLIEASRTFEANINLIRMQDESLGRLLQSVAG